MSCKHVIKTWKTPKSKPQVSEIESDKVAAGMRSARGALSLWSDT